MGTAFVSTSGGGRAVRRRTGNEWRAVARHFGRIRLTMFVGAIALGFATELALALVGATLREVSISSAAIIVAANMTVPMLVWTQWTRRTPLARALEIAASVGVATAAAIALYDIGAIPSEAVLVVQQVVMLPAMFGTMLWRAESYTR
jgi:hypothetical protein